MTRRLAVALAVVMALSLMVVPAGGAHKVTFIHTTESELSAGTTSNMIAYGGSDGNLMAGNVGTTATRDPDDSSASETERLGVEIDVDTNLTGITVDISGNVAGATTVYLQDTNGNILASAPISGGSARITHPLENGTKYGVTADAGGASYTSGWDSNPALPYTSADVDITGRARSTKTSTGSNPYNIKSVTALTAPSTAGYTGTGHSADAPDTGFANVTVQDASVDIVWEGSNDGSTWTAVNSTTVSASGNYSLELSGGYSEWRANVDVTQGTGGYDARLHDEGVTGVQTTATELDNASASPSGGEKLTSAPTFKINGSDVDFGDSEGDTVTLEWFRDGNSLGTTTETSNGTWTFDPPSKAGESTWHVEATDEYGHTTTSDTFSYETPSQLFIRNESNASELVDSATVTVRFFASDKVIERTTNDGTINLSGLPADETMIVTAEASGWHDRRVVIKSLYEQQSVYLLNTSVTTVDVTFSLDDKTGNYPSDSRLYVKKPINQSGSTKFRTVLADEFGAAGVGATLEKDQRYRLVVENPSGDTRTVGPYTATKSQTVTLTIGKLQYGLGDNDTYSWSANFTNATGTPYVKFNFSDPETNTTDLNVKIYERGNQSNEIYNNTFAGPLGEASVSKALTANQSEKAWVVEFEGTRNGKTVSGKWVVGKRSGPGVPMDLVWKERAAIGLLFVVGASVGAGMRSPEAAGIVISLLAGMLWYMSWLPAESGGGVVVVGLTFSGLMMWSKTRGAAT